MPAHALTRRIGDVLELQPDAAAIEYNGQWSTWRQVAGLAGAIKALDVGPRQVGILLRNRPSHVAAFLGVLLAGGTVVVINPSRGDDRTREDIEALDLPFIVGASDDLASLVPVGPTLVSISNLAGAPLVTPGRGSTAGRPEVAVRMLTSGTTGPPKRIDLTYDMLARSVIGPEAAHSPARRNCVRVSRSSTPRWCTSAASSVCCSVFVRHGLSRCWTASSSISGPKPCAGTAPARCRWCPRPCAWCCIRI
jgi:long-chain acyl-CoA synthetase